MLLAKLLKFILKYEVECLRV